MGDIWLYNTGLRPLNWTLIRYWGSGGNWGQINSGYSGLFGFFSLFGLLGELGSQDKCG